MSRITLTDNTFQILIKMSDGNPGAATILLKMLEADEIDPDSVMGGMMKILSLDTLEIYGTHIWVLYKDICDESMIKMFAVLRANQLGFVSGLVLKNACHRQDRSGREMIDVQALYEKVIEYLPNFKRLE